MRPGVEGMPFMRRGGGGAGRAAFAKATADKLVEMRLPGRRLFSAAVCAASAVLQAGGGAPSAPGSIALGAASGPRPLNRRHGKIYSLIWGAARRRTLSGLQMS